MTHPCKKGEYFEYCAVFDNTSFGEGNSRKAVKGKWHVVPGPLTGSEPVSPNSSPLVPEHHERACVVKFFKSNVTFDAIEWKEDFNTSHIASILAHKFNAETKTNKPISFIEPTIAKILSLVPNDMFLVKDELGTIESTLMSAFSHYTWHETCGVMLVCDLQGVRRNNGYVLTDPAVHSNGKGMVHGRTDLGQLGQALFFLTHVCNDFCTKYSMPSLNFMRIAMELRANPSLMAQVQAGMFSTYAFQLQALLRKDPQNIQTHVIQ